MTLLLQSIVLREESYTSFSITLQSFVIYFEKNNLKLELQMVRRAYCKVWFLPVALVPSIRRSYILTELSEQPTAR